MRKAVTLALLLSSLVPFACGGGTPPAKDADDTASASSAKGGGDDTSKSAAAADSSPPADTPAPAATPPAKADTSGDIKAPTGDDPWMAAHQIPAKDVVKTMRAAQGKVNACFREGTKRDPSTTGEVKLKFVITNDGTVRAWKDNASSMSDGDVTKCIGDVLSKQKFPKQKSPGDAWGTFAIAQ